MSDIDSLFELSKAAHRSGNFAVAAQGYAAILAVTPDAPQVWHWSGLLAHQTGRSDRGVNYLRRSLELGPNAERLTDLADIYLSLNEYRAAEQQAAEAIAIDPEASAAYYCLGVALSRQGRMAEALPHLHKAIDARHRLESALLETGLAFQALGDVASAIECYSALLEQNPREPAAYFHLSKFLLPGHYEFSSQQVDQIRSLLISLEDNSVPAVWLHFSLGAHFEATQEFHESFEYYRRANEIERQVLEGAINARSFSGLSIVVDRLIQYFDEDRVADLGGLGDPTRRPVFVVGLPRSGTTLCSQVLASHPDIVSVGESLALGEALRSLRSHWDTDEPVRDIDQQLIHDASSQYLEAISSINAEARYTVDKLPDNAMYTGFIRALFPQASIVHCRRDPRDVAISNFSVAFQSERLKWETSSLEIVAETIKQKTRLARHWKKLFPTRVTELFYESFVQSPKSETRRLLETLGIGWAPSCERPEQQRSVVESASSIQVRNPIYRSSSGRWRRFKSQLQPMLKMLQAEISEYEDELAAAMASTS